MPASSSPSERPAMRTSIRHALASTVLALGCLTGLSSAQAQPAAPSSLQETYQDWTVTCVQAEGDLNALLVLPFGLAVAEPVRLRHGGGEDLTIGVSTCLPAGCLAPARLGSAWFAQINDASIFEAIANFPGSSETATLTFSAKGFQDAIERPSSEPKSIT